MSQFEHKLIIVEGLTGLGKSTVAHFIERQLRYNGIPATWIHEGEDPHPVSVDIKADIPTFMAESLEKWQAFVAQVQKSGQVTVIEASTFNNLIEVLFSNCLAKPAIIEFWIKLEQVIQALNPALLYLTHGDIPAALEENFRNRGAGFKDFVFKYVSGTPIAKQRNWFDTCGVVRFWQEFVSLTDALFQQSRIAKLCLDVSAGEWERYNHQITGFLSLPWKPDPEISAAEAVDFTGSYRFQDDSKNFTIHYEDGILATDIFMNVKTKLIPKDDRSFLVEKWHFELVFERSESGAVKSLSIAGRDVDYLAAVGRKAQKVKL